MTISTTAQSAPSFARPPSKSAECALATYVRHFVQRWVSQAPACLALTLLRFEYDHKAQQRRKLLTRVEFQQRLTLACAPDSAA